MRSSPWNDERIARLKKLYAEGLSASEIAARIGGISRNSVIGKITRMGINKQSIAERRERLVLAKEKQAELRGRRGDGALSQAINRGPKRNSEQRTTLRIVEIEPLRKTILQCGDDECLYGFDASAEEVDRLGVAHVFCGHPTIKGKPYCPHHAAICYLPPQDRKHGWRAAA